MNIYVHGDSFPITKNGLERLKSELDAKKIRKSGDLREHLQDSWEQGDERENDAFTIAFEEYNILSEEIIIMEDLLKKVILISPEGIDTIQPGHVVTLLRSNDNVLTEYQLVGDIEVDNLNNMISVSSPLGSLLTGKKVGDKINLKTLRGKIEYLIKEIRLS